MAVCCGVLHYCFQYSRQKKVETSVVVYTYAMGSRREKGTRLPLFYVVLLYFGAAQARPVFDRAVSGSEFLRLRAPYSQ